MMVFWRQRLVFLATPKTGTTAIEAALGSIAAINIHRPPQLKHTNAGRFHRFVKPYLLDAAGKDAVFRTTAVMREPLEWLGSWYRYRHRAEETAEKSTKNHSFDDFIHAYCREDKPEFAKVGNQAHFLAPKPDFAVDHIFRYDAMTSFVRFLEHELSCRIDLPVMNVSPKADLALREDSRRMLDHYCARDFEIYESL